MNQDLTLNVSTVAWFAIKHAGDRGYTHFRSDAWLTEADIPQEPTSKMLWVDEREGSWDAVVEVGDAIITLTRERRKLLVGIYAESKANVDKWLQYLKETMPECERKSNLLDVTFWYLTQHGPRSYDRQLEAPSWKAIEENYPPTTREKLQSLQDTKEPEGGGKLILWQGEPGTGKTFALRALAEEWASWCKIHYVLDPERFFAEGDYLLSVILGSDMPQSISSTGEAAPEWRLIVLEDAGEMLAKDAKLQVGQGLARLLNLCDGLLGQGLRVLVLITTNEQMGTLHSAVSRPGRCLSQISFEKFDSVSAAKWLEAHGSEVRVVKNAALADLYAIARGAETQPVKVAAGF